VTVGPDFAFHPQTVTVQVGDTVTWTNAGGFHDLRADDGSFSTPGANDFIFSHTFTAAGTEGYHCTFHGAPGLGMFGTVLVEEAAPGGGGGGGEEEGQPGTLRFSLASYTVGEAVGTATVTVQRVGGDDGPVTVGYAATAGSAATADFTPVSGTLSWPAGNDSPKTFDVPIVDDAAVEGNETVLLALSGPTGGALLDDARKSATLTIQDNDEEPTPGGPLAAPTNLAATAGSTSEVALTWTDNSSGETGFQVEARRVDGVFEEVATTGAGATGVVVGGLDPSSLYLFRVRATGGTGSPFSNQVVATTLGLVGDCVPGPTALCLSGARFRVEVLWRIPEGTTGQGQAVPVPSAPDSGLVYFFSPSNLELLVKVLLACGLNERYWVFYAATTNVELALVVTDTQTGATRGYFNPQGNPAPPVQDTSAFATCP
jgi:hypothetical protein